MCEWIQTLVYGACLLIVRAYQEPVRRKKFKCWPYNEVK